MYLTLGALSNVYDDIAIEVGCDPRPDSVAERLDRAAFIIEHIGALRIDGFEAALRGEGSNANEKTVRKSFRSIISH